MEGSDDSDVTTDSYPCFICRQETNSFGAESIESDSQNVEERQLSVIYLVNKLLKVPKETCSKFLADFGNPEQWISICPNCSSVVEEGRLLYNQIKDLEQRHRDIGRQIRGQVRIKSEPGEQHVFGQATVAIRNELAILGANNDGDYLSECSQTSQSQNLMDFECKIEIAEEEDSMDFDEFSSKPSQDIDMDEGTDFEGGDVIEEMVNDDEEEFEVKVEQIDEDDPLGEYSSEFDLNTPPSSDIDTYSEPSSSQSQQTLQETTKKGRKRKADDDDDGDAEYLPPEKYFRPDGIQNSPKLKVTPQKTSIPKPTNETSVVKQVTTRQTVLSFATSLIPVYKCARCLAVFSSINEVGSHVHVCINSNFKLIAPAPTPEEQTPPQPPTPTPTPTAPAKSRAVRGPGPGAIKCDECAETVDNLANLEAHKRKFHLDPEALRCRGCLQSFLAIGYYKNHVLYGRNKKRIAPTLECVSSALRCDLGGCDPREVLRCSQPALDLHKKIHHTVLLSLPFTCQLCKANTNCPPSFSSEAELAEHMDRGHYPSSPTDVQLSCPHCSNVYDNKCSLRKHVLLDHDEALQDNPKGGRPLKLARKQ